MKKCSTCQDGWELMYGSCYKSSKKELKYDESVSFCKNLNASQAITKSVQELKFLYNVLQRDKIYFTEDNPYFYIWVKNFILII